MQRPTSPWDVFISYNRSDHGIAVKFVEQLNQRGVRAFFDSLSLNTTEPVVLQLENAICSIPSITVMVGPNKMGDWQQLERMLAITRYQRDQSYTLLPIILPGADLPLDFLGLFHCYDLRAGIEDAATLDRIAAAIQGGTADRMRTGLPAFDRPEETRLASCPYRGLQLFREEDAQLYFGRRRFASRLKDTADRKPIIAVLGPSGSGKSSLVRAGLLPHLRTDRQHHWLIVTMVPGRTPVRALMAALLQFFPAGSDARSGSDGLPSLETLVADLLVSRRRLYDVVTELLRRYHPTSRLLLFVDQWEELYSISENPTEAAIFSRELLSLAGATSPHRIIMTVRSDYYSQLLGDRSLSDRIEDAIVSLPRVTAEELEEAIVEPARRCGLSFEAGLVRQILSDVGDDAGALPLLEFCLRELWETARSRLLTHESYRAAGGVQGALTKRANEIFDAMTRKEQEATRLLFLELVRMDPDDAHRATRRKIPLAYLPSAAQEIAVRLADERSRLVILDAEGAEQLPTVTLVHEALIERWDRLRTWLQEAGEHLRSLSRLRAAADEWHRHGRRADFRWSDDRSIELAHSFQRLPRRYHLRAVDKDFLGPTSTEEILSLLRAANVDWNERAGLGDRLGILGDVRPGVGVDVRGLPSITWCRIRPGEVHVPASSGQGGPTSGTAPSETVMITEPAVIQVTGFSMAKYPVTVAQYRRFLAAADGYVLARWWDGDPPTGAPTHFATRTLNQPMVNVTWHEAMAFCRWLSSKTGESLTLPNEWQWQLAATGGDPRNIYPWGASWREGGVNCYETGLQRVIAVGLSSEDFSQPATGVADLVGNVWEWCANAYASPFEGKAGDTADRTIRGGGWNTSQKYATTDTRYLSRMTYRHMNVGFRLIRCD